MKSRIIGRKQLLTLSLVLALSLAVFVNWYYTKPQNKVTEPETTNQANLGDAQYVNSNVSEDESYFEKTEINRKKAHDSAIENLKNIINDEEFDEETKSLAREKLSKISEQIKIETDIESIIAAQTKSNCCVTYNDESIEVVLPNKTINNETIIKIKDIIISKTKLTADKITIIELSE